MTIFMYSFLSCICCLLTNNTYCWLLIDAAAEIERKRKEAELAAKKKREEEAAMMQKMRDDTRLADKVLKDYCKGSFYNVLEISKNASQDFITRACEYHCALFHVSSCSP